MWLALLAFSLVSHLPLDELGVGATVSGWVRVAGGELDGTEVTLSPWNEAPSSAGSVSTADYPRRFVSRSDERGYFEIPGVPSGRYRVEAEREGFASTPTRLVVPPRGSPGGSTVRLGEPLDLVPLARLEVAFEPVADPWGLPWRIEVRQAVGETSQYRTLAEGAADLAGVWRSGALKPAGYMVDVHDSKGSRWAYRDLQLVGGPEQLFWPIEVVYLAGTVSLGDEPLANIGIVWGPDREKIGIEADEEGRFEGFLPREGVWPIQVSLGQGGTTLSPVEVRRRPGKRVAEVEVRIPDTRLHGRVLAEGEPVRAVVVALTDSDLLGRLNRRKKAFDLFTDADGSFEVVGLVPATIDVTASARGFASDELELKIEEGETLEVEIHIRERVPFRGRLTSSFADPAGALVVAHPDAGYPVETTTSRGGYFELPLGPDVSQVDLAVIPPVGGIFFRRMHLEEGRPEWVSNVERAAGTVIFPDAASLLLGASGGGRYYLFHEGVGLPADVLMKKVLGRLVPHPSGGMALPSMAIGTWSLCKGPDPNRSNCRRARLFDGGEIVLGSQSGDADEASGPQPRD